MREIANAKMKTASSVAQKWVTRAGAASADYVAGAQGTSKDQSARAIAAKGIYQSSLQASFVRDSYAKGLGKSGKGGWLNGVVKKGEQRYGPGVAESASAYATNSGRFDGARAASDNMPRGQKGSPQNVAKVAAVVNALHALKVA